MVRPTILLADDDRAICTVLSQAIRKLGCNVVSTDDANELLSWVKEGKGNMVITDVMMPKGNGLEFLPKIKENRPELPVVVISANNTLMTAVHANELGAYEYFPKPFDLDDIVSCVRSTLADELAYSESLAAAGETEQAKTATDGGAPQSPENSGKEVLVGRSPAMQEVYKILARVVAVDLTVLVHGESGTGKELVARTLHQLGPRKEKPFIAINMAAIPKELVESELFGHEKGAFTGAMTRKSGRFEQAEGGTLFLDEIGDMPADAQTKLLRALQEKEYIPVGGTTPRKTNVRIVCATHRDLLELTRRGDFREDLYYRLNVVPIQLPPLRKRREDIGELARDCLRKARVQGLPEKQLSDDALQALEAYDWPGNVRELQNVMFRLMALYSENVITGQIVQKELGASAAVYDAPVDSSLFSAAAMATPSSRAASLQSLIEQHLQQYFATLNGALPPPGLYDRVIQEVEKPLLKLTLETTRGNQIKAAEVLGINRNTLRTKLRDLGIDAGEVKATTHSRRRKPQA